MSGYGNIIVEEINTLPRRGCVLFYSENKESYKLKRIFADCARLCPGVKFYGYKDSLNNNPSVKLFREYERVDVFSLTDLRKKDNKLDINVAMRELLDWILISGV